MKCLGSWQNWPITQKERSKSSIFTRRRIHKPAILMYHAVTRVEADPDRICVSPEQFQDQVAFLKHLGLRGVSVQELLRAMGQGEAKGLVGFTFDDGYANFSQDVLPVLERYGFT